MHYMHTTLHMEIIVLYYCFYTPYFA